MTGPQDTRRTVIPTLRYKDAAKAVDWLCQAFGFEKHLVVPGEDGTIAHAQLAFGNGMIMLGSAGGHGPFDELVTTALDAGKPTGSPYVIVEDADAHQARAEAAGAEILMPCEDPHYGGRLYTCRDFEGNVWSFGTYDPWSG